MTVVIGSSCFSINIKTETEIRELMEITVSKEELERAEMLFEGLPETYEKQGTNREWISDPKLVPRADLRSPQLQAQISGGQIIRETPGTENNPIGRARLRSVPTIPRIEAKRRFTWVRDWTIKPSTSHHGSREAEQRLLTKGLRWEWEEVGSGSGASGGRSNASYPDEGKGRGDFQIWENGSNFPFIIQGEDGALTLDKRISCLEQREGGQKNSTKERRRC